MTGCLEDTDDNYVAMFRTIKDITDYLDRAPVGLYIDLKTNSIQQDKEKSANLQSVLFKDVLCRLSQDNMKSYCIKYHDPEGVTVEKHEKYLEDVANDFFNKAKPLIDRHMSKKLEVLPKLENLSQGLLVEILQHWTMTAERCQEFSGREAELDDIAMYLLDDTDQPLVIVGDHGIGKTSLIDMAASHVIHKQQQQFPSGEYVNAQVIIRHCGTTVASTNLRQMLRSLCQQAVHITGYNKCPIPTSHYRLIHFFRDLLMRGDFQGMLILFLDGLDQLSACDQAHQLQWLPAKLANNVKVIVSTTPTDNDVYRKLCSKITNDRYHLPLCRLPGAICRQMITDWLHGNSRIVNYHQWKNIKQAIGEWRSPMYIKMAFDEAMLWPSYMDPDDSILPDTTEACLVAMLDRLERKHGKLLFSRCMQYLTVSQYGLSHCEMEDLLSLDDEVLNSIFVHWQPSIRRIPSFYWAKVYNDITIFLTHLQVDDTPIMNWAQQQCREVFTKRYLKSAKTKQKIHSALSDYFLGTYSGTFKKPFTYNNSLRNVLHIKEVDGEAVRYVAEQPLQYDTTCTRVRYNLRKLNQLCHHLINAGRKKDACREIFFNYRWLLTKLKACGTEGALSDYSAARQTDHDVALVADALEACQDELAEDVNVLGVELSGRLLAHADVYPSIRNLIDQIDLNCVQICPIVPHWQVYKSPGTPISFTCRNPDGKGEARLMHNEDRLVLISKTPESGTASLWDVHHCEKQPDLQLTSASEYHVTPNGQYVHLIIDKNHRKIVRYKVDSEEICGQIHISETDARGCIVVGNKYTAMCFKHAPGPLFIDTEANTIINRFHYQCSAVTLSRDERHVACHSDAVLHIHETPLMDRTVSIHLSSRPVKINYVGASNTTLALMLQDKNLVLVSYVVTNPANKRFEHSVVFHDIEMQDFTQSNSGAKLICRASRCLYVFQTKSRNKKFEIRDMPRGVFVERVSTFQDAGFSSDDSMVVFIRHTLLGVWDSETGDPLRVLQTSVQPITQLLLSHSTNHAVTVHKDGLMCVWNLDHLDTDVQMIPQVISGPITHMAVAKNGSHVICCGNTHAEARIYNVRTGECDHTIAHVKAGMAAKMRHMDQALTKVDISPSGHYAITSMPLQYLPTEDKPWPLLTDDKLWTTRRGRFLRGINSNRKVVCSHTDDKVIFFPCRHHNVNNWDENEYNMNIFIFSPEQEELDNYLVELPRGDFVGDPVFTKTGQILAMIFQVQPTEENDLTRPVIRLLLYSFEKLWKGIKYVKLQKLWSGYTDRQNFLDVQTMEDDNLLLVYSWGLDCLGYTTEGVLDRSLAVRKGALVYDVREDCVLKRHDHWLGPDSDITTTLVSKNTALLMDQNMVVYSGVTSASQSSLSSKLSSECRPSSLRLLMKGLYVVAVSSDSKQILMFRTSDGVKKARLFVHGTIVSMETGGGGRMSSKEQEEDDDRTIVVSCTDGRIMVFSTTIQHCNSLSFIKNLPSRSGESYLRRLTLGSIAPPDTTSTSSRPKSAAASRILPMDVRSMRKTLNEHRHLSAITCREHAKTIRKPPPYRVLSNAIPKSQACCIQ